MASRFQFQLTPVLRVLLHSLRLSGIIGTDGFEFFDIFKKLTVIFYIQQDANALAVFIHYKTFFQGKNRTSPSYFREAGEVTVDPSRPIPVLP